jgi:hypothetical protein
MKKPGKLQAILTNKALKDDMTIAVGDESFTLGELRSMDAESEGGSTAELEAREANLVRAQSALADTLQKAADRMGVPIDKLIDGQLDDIAPRRGAPTGGDDEEDAALAEVDPRILAALEKRLEKKLGSATSAASIAKIEKELGDTRKALGIALKINMDDHYERTFRDLSKDIPEGVKLDLQSALKYADENNLRDKTGRYNIHKAVNDLTSEARTKKMIADAEARGEERARQKALADSVRPGAGAPGHSHLKPPVDDKGRTHSIEHQLQAALEDSDIQRMIAGVPAGSA